MFLKYDRATLFMTSSAEVKTDNNLFTVNIVETEKKRSTVLIIFYKLIRFPMLKILQ